MELGVHTLALSVFPEPFGVFEEREGWAKGRHRGKGSGTWWER